MNRDDRRRMLMAGAGLGAATGVIAAFLLMRRAEKSDLPATITAGESFRLGILVIGLLRSIAQLTDAD